MSSDVVIIPPAKKGENKKAAHRPRIAHSCAGDDCFVHFLSFPASFPVWPVIASARLARILAEGKFNGFNGGTLKGSKFEPVLYDFEGE